jgi:hypothetical protein
MMVRTVSDSPPRADQGADQRADQGRPVAYVAMRDSATRARIVAVFERACWTVNPQPTGFHLVRAMADVIEGRQPWLLPGMIVVDAQSRGCAGTTIAAGLRELGITIPIVLVAAPGEALPISSDETLRIVDASTAPLAVAALAEARPPHAGPPRPTA